MSKGRWVLRFALLALLALAISSTAFLRSSPAMADAVGCTGYPNTRPMSTGSCEASPDEMCYMCEHNYNGGADISCSESPDGSIAYCKPFRLPVNP
ncbi:MAG TPA: hypothetical protein VIA62_10305 [Thermoanaerobaculia bacterium]|nr:hypothetical protein [Thermoanaerobaculia bacterium]